MRGPQGSSDEESSAGSRRGCIRRALPPSTGLPPALHPATADESLTSSVAPRPSNWQVKLHCQTGDCTALRGWLGLESVPWTLSFTSLSVFLASCRRPLLHLLPKRFLYDKLLRPPLTSPSSYRSLA